MNSDDFNSVSNGRTSFVALHKRSLLSAALIAPYLGRFITKSLINMTQLARLSRLRWPWLILSISAFGLVGFALYLQHGLGLEPCVKCIYQRVAVLTIGVAGLIPLINPERPVLRSAGYLLWLTGAGWGLIIAHEHYSLQYSANAFFMVCDTFPNFPSYLPLHEWLPGLFGAPGLCGDIDWQFLGWSMPAWMRVIFSLYLVIGLVVLVSSLWVYRRV